MSERWVDELMPDEPQWVRDMVDEELTKRDVNTANAQAAAAELAARLAEVEETLGETNEALAACQSQGAAIQRRLAKAEVLLRQASDWFDERSDLTGDQVAANIDAFLAPDSADGCDCGMPGGAHLAFCPATTTSGQPEAVAK